MCRIVRGGGAQPLIIGNGTNLLITDGALERIVVQMGDNMAAVTQPDATHLSAAPASRSRGWRRRRSAAVLRGWSLRTASPGRWAARCR